MDAPHVRIEDLAVIFYILVSSDAEGTGTITVRNNMLSFWNVDTDVLYELALANTQRMFRGTVQSMANVMIDILSKQMDEEEIKATIKSVLDSLGIEAPTAKEKGIIMKNLMPLTKGKADGKLVNDILSSFFA